MKRALAIGALVLGACGPAQEPLAPAANDDPTARVRAFEATEDEALRDLAAIDRRLAARTRLVPRDDDLRRVALSALFADDPTLAAVDGAIDPFSFDARGRGLEAVKKKVDGSPAQLPADAALERQLLSRLVDEEIARLAEERNLPRSASALVRAVVDTWTAPAKADQAAARDRWLARRLGEIRASLESSPVDVARARELDDALDALEHDIDTPGFAASTAELVKLRDALESKRAPSPRASAADWTAIGAALGAHVGVHGSPDAIERALAIAVTRLRPRAETAAESSRLAPDALASGVGGLVFATAPCADTIAASRVRSVSAPPERLAACHLRHAVKGSPSADAVALVAMHDHVIVARWALMIARGASLSEATAKHHLLSRPSPDILARWERMAVARPVLTIGAGLAAAILGNEDVTRTAKSWTELGDMPLDLAVRRVAGPPAADIY